MESRAAPIFFQREVLLTLNYCHVWVAGSNLPRSFFCTFRKTKKHDLQNMTTLRAPRCIEPRNQPETFFSSVFGLDLCEFWIPFCCQFRFRFRWELDSDLANIWIANCLKIFHKILQNFVGNLLNVASTWQRHLSRVLYDRMTRVLSQCAKRF